MTIRYECGQCGSILKIKDELAGKPGKCPKCKTAFTIPNPNLDSGEVSLSDEPPPAEEPLRKTPASDEEFDPAAFLMQEDSPPPKRGSSKKAASKKDEGRSSDDGEDFRIRRNESSTSKSKSSSLDDDEDDEPGSRKLVRQKPVAVTAVAASNAAGDLLSQSAKKGRKTSWNEVDPNARAESGFDWAGFWQYAGKEFGAKIGGGIAIVAVLFFGSNWLMSGRSNLPDLGQVTGQVTLAGQPVPGATVLFHPIRTAEERKDKKKDATTATAITDDQGKYEMIYVVNVKGAPIGKCRIEIDAPSQPNIPKKWFGIRPKDVEPEFREVKRGRQVHDLDLSE